MGRPGQLGRVAAGQLADLVLVDTAGPHQAPLSEGRRRLGDWSDELQHPHEAAPLRCL